MCVDVCVCVCDPHRDTAAVALNNCVCECVCVDVCVCVCDPHRDTAAVALNNCDHGREHFVLAAKYRARVRVYQTYVCIEKKS